MTSVPVRDTRWRIAFKVYRNDRLVYRGDTGSWPSYRSAAHIADSYIQNADNEIEGAGDE